MNVRIIENSFLAKMGKWKLKSSNVALTWGHSIHLSNISKVDFLINKTWVCHELTHVLQYEKYGLIKFTFMYAWESFRHGYYNNKWEVEARQNERNFSILEQAKFVNI